MLYICSLWVSELKVVAIVSTANMGNWEFKKKERVAPWNEALEIGFVKCNCSAYIDMFNKENIKYLSQILFTINLK